MADATARAGGEASGPHTVLIIRHGEKPDASHPGQPPFGQDRGGKRDPHSLTPLGWERADKLADLFAGHTVRAPFVRPDRLYAPDYGSQAQDRKRRTYQTLTPTADRLGIRIRTPHPLGDEIAMAHHLAEHAGARILVCWEHHHIPALAAALAHHLGVTTLPANAHTWPEDDYSTALVFTARPGQYVAVQTSEAALPTDPRP